MVDETTGRTLFSVAPRGPPAAAGLGREAVHDDHGAARARTNSEVHYERPTGGEAGAGTASGRGRSTCVAAAIRRSATHSSTHVSYGTGATVQQLAVALKLDRDRRIDGSIVGDGSYFDSRRGTPATGIGRAPRLEGELDALSYDAGCRAAPTDRCSPIRRSGRRPRSRRYWPSRASRFSKHTPITTGSTPAGARLLASVSSPPLSKILRADQLAIRQLLRRDAAEGSRGARRRRHDRRGCGVVKATIAGRLGLHPRVQRRLGTVPGGPDDCRRHHHAAARRCRSNPTFTNSLAIAGVRGTMVHEMVGDPRPPDTAAARPER